MEARSRRKRHALRLLLVGLFAVAVLSSCQLMSLLFGVTIDERIKDFSNGYTSGDYTNLYKNFSSTSTQEYNNIKPSSYWSNTPFDSSYHPKAITSYSVSGSTVTGTFTNDNGNYSFTMQMQESGINWYIQSLSLQPAGSTSSTPTFEIKLMY